MATSREVAINMDVRQRRNPSLAVPSLRLRANDKINVTPRVSNRRRVFQGLVSYHVAHVVELSLIGQRAVAAPY